MLQTLDSSGEEAFLPYETTAHNCTGPLIRDDTGKVVGMGNDPTGVGLREYQLLRRRHRFRPSCVHKRLSGGNLWMHAGRNLRRRRSICRLA